MLIIRLNKTGKKNSPNFRIILTEKTAAPQSGKFLEVLGSYNPRSATGKREITLKKERISHWLSKGVQVSDTVHNLLLSEGVIKGAKIKKKITPSKKAKKGEETKEEVKKEEPVEKEKVEEKEEDQKEKKGETKEPSEEKEEESQSEDKASE